MKANADTSGSKDKVTGRFLPGHDGGGRRERGQHNKITRDLKEGIVTAAIQVGEDGKGKGGLVGYLRFLARKQPKAFSQLLGRVLPLQISATPGSFIGSVNIIPVPPDKYLSAEQVAAMMAPATDPVIVDRNPHDENVVPFERGEDHDYA